VRYDHQLLILFCINIGFHFIFKLLFLALVYRQTDCENYAGTVRVHGVIDVHMGDHQRADVFDGKIDGQIVCRGPATRLLTLEQPAVDENAVLAPMTGFDTQFMAGAGDAGGV